MNSVKDILADAERRLQTIATARLDAEILLASSMHIGRAGLYTHPEREVSEDIVNNFQQLLEKRIDDYPIAYLTGSKEFWSLQLKVNQHTLIPRPETECLVETALERIPVERHCDILDLGTGSGAIALAIAKERPNANICALDLSHDAITIAKENAKAHQLKNIQFTQSDWFSNLGERQFDYIVSNPPYVEPDDHGFIEGEIRYEPRLALDGGQQGIQPISQIISTAPSFLRNDAWIFIEHGYQQAKVISQLLINNHYDDISCRQDYAGLDRLSFARWL
jgi:release factor glutamine methyltransferase